MSATDAAEWSCCSTSKTAIDDLEPLPDNASDYRQAALHQLAKIEAIDNWLARSSDARLAWVAVALVFKLTSVRGYTELEIAAELGVPIGRFDPF